MKPLAIGLLLTLMANGQSGPQFEVAAIKLNKTGGPGISTGTPSPGRYEAENVFLRFLIQAAWNVRAFQIVGIPDSFANQRFDIQASMKPGATRDEINLMLQALLEDRFQLKLHREMREQPIYTLSLARNGAKIQPLPEGNCITLGPGAPPPPREPGQAPPKFCGGSSWGPSRIKGTGISMDVFTTLLGDVMQRTVVNNTGLKGLFDIALEWAPDETTPGQFAPGVTRPPTDNVGPSIFTAIQEQLGLRLESGKGPVEVLVVDSVESPSEN